MIILRSGNLAILASLRSIYEAELRKPRLCTLRLVAHFPDFWFMKSPLIDCLPVYSWRTELGILIAFFIEACILFLIVEGFYSWIASLAWFCLRWTCFQLVFYLIYLSFSAEKLFFHFTVDNWSFLGNTKEIWWLNSYLLTLNRLLPKKIRRLLWFFSQTRESKPPTILSW